MIMMRVERFAKFAARGVLSEPATDGILYRLEECWNTVEAQRRQIADRDEEIRNAHLLLDELLGQGREPEEGLSERILKFAVLTNIHLLGH